MLEEGAGGKGGRQGRHRGDERTPHLDLLGVEGATPRVGKGTTRITEGGRATCVGQGVEEGIAWGVGNDTALG